MDKLLNEAVSKQVQEVLGSMIHPVEVLLFAIRNQRLHSPLMSVTKEPRTIRIPIQ